MLIIGIWLLAVVEKKEVYSGEKVHRLDVGPLNSRLTLSLGIETEFNKFLAFSGMENEYMYVYI